MLVLSFVLQSSFAIVSLGKRELVALLLLFSDCHVAIVVLRVFLTVLWIGLYYVTVAFPGTGLFC